MDARSLCSCGFWASGRVAAAWLSQAISDVCCPFAARAARLSQRNELASHSSQTRGCSGTRTGVRFPFFPASVSMAGRRCFNAPARTGVCRGFTLPCIDPHHRQRRAQRFPLRSMSPMPKREARRTSGEAAGSSPEGVASHEHSFLRPSNLSSRCLSPGHVVPAVKSRTRMMAWAGALSAAGVASPCLRREPVRL